MVNKISSIQRVKDALDSLNIPTEVKELPNSTRTAREAAAAVECKVGQIVKSLVFFGVESQRGFLILTSGSNQVNEEIVSGYLGEKIKFAPADFVREETGFAIGGVAPFGLKNDLDTFIDEDLLIHKEIWAAAGSPNAVFMIQPQTLVDATRATVIPVH